MANFTRLRASGLWVPGSTILQAELEQIDDDRTKTINATDGSTHAPTTQIVIGGSGFAVPAPAPSAFGNVTSLTASGGVTCNSTLTVNGTATLNGTVNATSNAQINTLFISSANPIGLVSTRTYTRPCRPTPYLSPTYWTHPGFQAPIHTYFTHALASTNTGARIIYDMDVPNGSVITGASMWIFPPGGHGALPTNMPRMLIYRQDRAAGGNATLLATVTDTSPDVPTYETRHHIISGVLAISINATDYSYILVVEGESDGTAASGGLYEIPDVTFTRTSLAEER